MNTTPNNTLTIALERASKEAAPPVLKDPAGYHRFYRARTTAFKLIDEIQKDISAGRYFNEALFKSWTEEAHTFEELNDAIRAYKRKTVYHRSTKVNNQVRQEENKAYQSLKREAIKAYKTNAHARLSLIIKRAATLNLTERLKEDLLKAVS